MKRVLGPVLAGLTLLCGGAMAVAACAHDDSTLFVRNVLAPPLVTAGQTCTYTSDPTQPYLPSGMADTALISEYTPVYLLGNQMVQRGDPNKPAAETSRITIQGAVVRITDTSGKQLRTYTRLTSATLDPSTGTLPSYIAVSVTAIDDVTLASAAVQGPIAAGHNPRLISYVRFFGQTLGGQSVESDEFEFPVDVCFGCLVRFSAGDINPNFPQPNCLNSSTSSSSSQPEPCTPGQDFPIDCSACRGVPACEGKVTSVVILDGGTG